MTDVRRLIKMEQQLTLRVRPGETVRFPAVCVACGQPAGERLTLQKRRGQLTRRIDAPLCAECARRLARRSGQEEQLLRLSWPAAAGTALLLAIVALAVLPFDAWWPRLLVGLIIGLAGSALVRWVLVRRAIAAELPERRTVREAARIDDFTWRDMTLVFSNGEMAERVRAMNPAFAENTTPDVATETPATPAEELSI